MNTILALGWRNLWRHKRRTWLTLGAMMFSNVLLVFMITLQIGNYDMMIDNSLKAFSGHLQIATKGYNDEPRMRSTVADIDALAQELRAELPELNVAPRALTFVLASSEQRSFGLQIAGVDIEHEASVSSIPGLISEGQYLSADRPRSIVIGEVLARNLKVGAGDELTLLGSGVDGSFAADIVTVSGLFKSGIIELDRSLAQMSLSDFQTLFAMDKKGHSIVISSNDVNQTLEYQQRVQALMQQQDADNAKRLEVLDWKTLNPGLQQAIQSDLVSSWFMYIILIVLVSLSVLNTQLMSVLERTREFGIMTAIGLRPARLGRLVLLETAIMAGLGFLIGTFCGLLVALYFNKVGFTIPGMEQMAAQYNLSERMYPAISPLSIMIGPFVVFIGCLLAAIYPVIKLQKIQPVAAMRAV